MPSPASTSVSRSLSRVGVALASALAFLPFALLAQRPADPRVTRAELPMRPDTIWVHKTDVGIMVTWSPVEGAKGYFLGRTSGNDGWTRLQTLTGGQLSYHDRAVRFGVPHRYQVATIDPNNRMSIRVNSEAIVPQAAPAEQPRIPLRATATVVGPGVVGLAWETRGYGQEMVIRHTKDGLVASRTQSIMVRQPGSLLDTIPPGSVADQLVSYEVVPQTQDREKGRSNTVTVTILPKPTLNVPATAIAAAASVLVTVATPAEVRVNESTRLPADAGAQWVSLHPGIATVSGDGTVSGRSAGEAQIVAVSRGANGAVHVSVARVTVSP